jgi:1-acyl-sn-glycerol-3-phosphate acyltransferase
MWALLVTAIAALVVLVRWWRSRLSFVDFFLIHITRLYARLWHRCSWRGPVPLPAKGPALLVANHTCSADPTFLVASCRRLLSFAVAREHFDLHPVTHWVLEHVRCVPVTRNGRDAGAAHRLLGRLAEGCAVCIFPEGGLSGVVRQRFRPRKHGAAFLALASGVPVYPAYIAGGPRTDDLLKSWLVPTPRAVRVYFGPAVDLSAYRGQRRTRRLLEEVTALLSERILALQPEAERKRLAKRLHPGREG